MESKHDSPEVGHALLLSALWSRIAAERTVLLELRERGDRCTSAAWQAPGTADCGRQIAGVCIGVAQANGWDVTLVRILTVVGCLFTSGLVGVAYLAGWIGIPEEPIAMPGYPPNVPNIHRTLPGGYPPSV